MLFHKPINIKACQKINFSFEFLGMLQICLWQESRSLNFGICLYAGESARRKAQPSQAGLFLALLQALFKPGARNHH
jgi:hypothetical protein